MEFDFLGKDSVRWVKVLNNPEPVLVQNLRRFTAKKKPTDEIFDVVTSSMVNRFLSEIIPGLTAKVFRTYHATVVTEKSLSSRDMREADDLEKRYFAKEANLAAAEFCNHKRTPPKNWDESLKKKEAKLAEYRAKGKEAMAKKMELDVAVHEEDQGLQPEHLPEELHRPQDLQVLVRLRGTRLGRSSTRPRSRGSSPGSPNPGSPGARRRRRPRSSQQTD